MGEYHKYPRVRYFNDGTSVTVANQAEEDAIEGEHFDLPDGKNHPEGYDAEDAASVSIAPANHVHHEYPKMMADQATVVENAEEEAAWKALNVVETEEAAVEEVKQGKKSGGGKEGDNDDLL